MKKLGILFFAALLVVAFTMPAAALENEFGGYWRTRFINQTDFTGDDSGDADMQRVDTRTRLYYTAIINDNLKFVNKFEMNAVWGAQDPVSTEDGDGYYNGTSGYGDLGADGLSVLVKNSYADFTVGSINAKVGAQGLFLSRGFMFDNDISGAVITFKGEGFDVPFIWGKVYEGGSGNDANDYDVDYYGINPTFSAGDALKINPFFMYLASKDAGVWDAFGDEDPETADKVDLGIWWLGVNVDFAMDNGAVWFTGIYSGGTIDVEEYAGYYGYYPEESIDLGGYLLALGGNMDLGGIGLHGQVFYATGDDNDEDNDEDAFMPTPGGTSYYWSEIMGYGTFDENSSANSPADVITNILAANLGVSFKPMDKLTLGADLWYAKLVEDDEYGNNVLGTEIDLSATYQLVEGLNLDVVAAYLFAGDATYDGEDDANPFELGARLSLSF